MSIGSIAFPSQTLRHVHQELTWNFLIWDNLQSDFCGDEGLQEGILLFHKIIMDKLKVPLAGRLAPQGPWQLLAGFDVSLVPAKLSKRCEMMWNVSINHWTSTLMCCCFCSLLFVARTLFTLSLLQKLYWNLEVSANRTSSVCSYARCAGIPPKSW